jgi:hypothetical protein
MRERLQTSQPKQLALEPETTDPVASSHSLHDLQRKAGNAAVVAMVGAQAKLTVGAVHDPAEREADRVAAEVMRRLDAGEAGDPAVATTDGGVARSIRRKASSAALDPNHGPEGGEVAADVAARIDGSRGGGTAMEDGVRRSMEGAFGADFSGVRIHTGGEADTLSTSLNARAFTTGKDIFFANGQYDPASKGGRETLAHELTHTVQQGGAGESQRISRLAVAGTNWESAKTANVSSSGAVGVAIVSDGGEPVVVKPAEPMAAELLMSANLINESIGDEKEGGWGIGTPDVRIASKTETARIKKVITTLLGDRAEQDREKGWLSQLGSPDTVIFSHAKGEDFTKIVANEKATKKKFLSSKRETRKDSTVADMVAKPGQLTQLGKTAALDIFMGNSDRLLGLFNMDNWMVDPKTKTISLIDNVLAGPAGTMTTVTTYGAFGGGQANITTARDGFDAWSADGWLSKFCADDLAYIAGEIVVNIVGSFKVSSRKNGLRPEDQAVMAAQIAANEGNMATWLAQGLAAGKQAMAATLKDPMKLIAGLPEEKRLEALTSLYARSFFIQGASPDNAWEMALHIAEVRLGVLHAD